MVTDRPTEAPDLHRTHLAAGRHSGSCR
jgi:hypothetical protein